MTTIIRAPKSPLPTALISMDRDALQAAYERAWAWAEHGYTADSRHYWTGMRDTLAVLLGITTARPINTGPDSDRAADVMLPGCRPIAF